MESQSTPEAPRSCGECSLCCTVLRVDPLAKLGGVPCVHQQIGSAAACAIHGSAERPALCGAYRCAWLQGRFEERDRPDRLGAVCDFGTAGGEPGLLIREVAAGTFDGSPRLREIAEQVRASMPVRITSSDDVMDADREYRILLPDRREQRVRGDRIEHWVDGDLQRTARLPLLERSLRRVALAFQRWRLRGYRGHGSASPAPSEPRDGPSVS